ncbi:MAG: phosphoribosyltransferase [Pseudomonadota bacterium]|jgi:ATP phosphoribosyltransferase
MQEASRSKPSKFLPRLGEGLSRLRGWENDFRMLASGRGFSELNLPLSLPSSEFVSGLTGETILPGAPRFLDTNATAWSLRSDLTLFAAQFVRRHKSELQFPFKLFYSGKVFSPQGLLGAEGFRLGHASEFESYEFGAEIVGQKEFEAETELLDLALDALQGFGYRGLRVVFGDARLLRSLEEEITAKIPDAAQRSASLSQLKSAVQCKDLAQLEEILVRSGLNSKAVWENSEVYRNLLSVAAVFRQRHPKVLFQIDPLLTRQRSFYSGIVFDFWAEDAGGRLHSVGGGGRYDELLQHFGLSAAAAGFMIRDPQSAGVQDDLPISQRAQQQQSSLRRPVRVALPKGRLQKWGVEAFARVGIRLAENADTTRKLVIPSECGRFEFLLVKNADVVSYVERGIAEIAVAGSDVLDEETNALLRPVTFAFGRCRICLAGKPEQREVISGLRRTRIATKYPNLAMRLLQARGLNPELLPLQGSVELASVISFSDAIVDLVETGSTLRENGLIVFEELTQTRVQLVMSRGYYVESHGDIRHWLAHWRASASVVDAHFELFTPEALHHDPHSEKS